MRITNSSTSSRFGTSVIASIHRLFGNLVAQPPRLRLQVVSGSPRELESGRRGNSQARTPAPPAPVAGMAVGFLVKRAWDTIQSRLLRY